jgi:hypothetical protein
VSGPYEAALQQLLPPREQGLLLAACFREGHCAHSAWSEFVAIVGDAKSYFETNHTGLKGLLPFVESCLSAKGIDAGKAFHTYARVALVREELRSRILLQILDEVLTAAEARAIPMLLLKGAAVSATAYPQPSTRHTHAIDLLVHTEHLTAAKAMLSQLRSTALPPGPGAVSHQSFRHPTGLALGLHSRPFFLPYFELPPETLGANTRTIELEGRAVHVMSPEANIVHVCGHAIYSRSRANLRWACDLALLLRQNPHLDWALLTDIAVQAGLAVVLLTQLRWVDETLCRVPGQWLQKLSEHSKQLNGDTLEGLYASLLHTTQSRRQAFAALSSDWRAQLGFLRFSAAPSRRYLRWKHNVEGGWRLAMCYADRPRRLARRFTRFRPVGVL